jgi:NADP-dependent 3-hydroxy acid dehydrogenase YdfG
MRNAAPLSSQVALITGASSGLGRAAARAFAEAGAHVVLLARSQQDLEEVAGELQASNREVLALPTDLADEVQTADAVSRALDTFGCIDILVNAAGTDVPGPVRDLAPDDWDRVLAVNLRAPFLLAKAVFPGMAQRGRGTIINISSVAGKRGWANAAAYCASKFGLTGFTQALAAEGKPHGIRACVVYPGAMATSWGTWSGQERQEAQGGTRSPAEALPPEEVAALLVWIAAAPPQLVLNEVIATPLEEQGWP